jgi:signal transduction histidine kinase
MTERSIARRLLWATGLGSLLIALAVALAAALAVREEVGELLDDALMASALQLAPLMADSAPMVSPAVPTAAPASAASGEVRFAWSWFDSAGRQVRGSAEGSARWAAQVKAGTFADSDDWRLYAHALPDQGLLVVAQTRQERREVTQELTEYALFGGLAVVLLALPLLAWRVHLELRPLDDLAQRLTGFNAADDDPRALSAALGPASRQELAPIHHALTVISERLSERLSFEREFSAQAAHLLRTPLAGMDAQLAVALKESPGQPRLQRVRDAAQRLQHMVLALLRLYRTNAPLERRELDAHALLASLPLGDLVLERGPACPIYADPLLLAAALINLVDNAQRHEAKHLRLTQPQPQCLLLTDDGSGLQEGEREALLSRLQGHASPDHGLGLRLALLVARAHGGTLELPTSPQGFAIRLSFQP